MTLRAEGEDALCLVELRGFEPLTPCMPCSFGLLSHRTSGTGGQPNGFLQVTVADRYIPLVTAAYGTRVARPARTTTFGRGGVGFQLGQRVRPVLGDHCLVDKSPEGSRQSAGETRTLAHLMNGGLVVG
jgi:hypothetical protein